MLGERIRTLRKQQKMTLEALAGNELTKGMISLIENNKANPSMESLMYIAGRLGVEVSDLLEEISSQELREILEKAETLHNEKKLNPADNEKAIANNEQIIELITPYVSKLTQGYESARLLDIYSRSLFYEKKKGWQPFADKAATLYEEMNLIAQRVDIGIFRSRRKFFEHKYSECLTILLSERAEIEAKYNYLDPMTRLDLDYHEAVLHFAVGDTKSAIRVMENAISLSKENRIFYRIDDLYRLAAAHAMMEKNIEKNEYYSKKLKLYGEFADDFNSILFYHLMIIDSLIYEKKDYEQALEKIDAFLSDRDITEIYKPYFYLGKGKALFYLGSYLEALDWLKKVSIPSVLHHPFDLSLFYVKDSYQALCLLELKDWTQAYQLGKAAVENFEGFPHSPFKEFAIETYRTIQKKSNDPKRAE